MTEQEKEEFEYLWTTNINDYILIKSKIPSGANYALSEKWGGFFYEIFYPNLRQSIVIDDDRLCFLVIEQMLKNGAIVRDNEWYIEEIAKQRAQGIDNIFNL